MRQGSGKVLLRQLTKKFGGVSWDVKQKIEHADEEQLLRWAELILSAESIADIFGE